MSPRSPGDSHAGEAQEGRSLTIRLTTIGERAIVPRPARRQIDDLRLISFRLSLYPPDTTIPLRIFPLQIPSGCLPASLGLDFGCLFHGSIGFRDSLYFRDLVRQSRLFDVLQAFQFMFGQCPFYGLSKLSMFLGLWTLWVISVASLHPLETSARVDPGKDERLFQRQTLPDIFRNFGGDAFR